MADDGPGRGLGGAVNALRSTGLRHRTGLVSVEEGERPHQCVVSRGMVRASFTFSRPEHRDGSFS